MFLRCGQPGKQTKLSPNQNLTAQASILWACNKAAFGIKPSRPLRSLILQAEDDDGDMQEMGEIVNHLNLKDDEIRTVDTNTFVEPCNDLFVTIC